MDTWFLADQALRAVPNFSGRGQDYPNWIRLAKKYAELTGVSEETKLAELKKKLSGRPLELVGRISSMDPKAVNRFFRELKEEYGDARAIYLSQMKRIDSLQAPSFKYEEMRNFYCTIKDVVSCLKALGLEPPRPDPTLEKLVAKLPPSWRTSFFEKYEQRAALSEDDDPNPDKLYSTSAKATVQNLLDYLQYKIAYLRRAEQTQEIDKPKTGGQGRNSKPDKGRPARTYANLPKDEEKEASKLEKAVKSEEKGEPAKRYCHQCKKDGHTLVRCKAYHKMSPSERVQLAYDNRLHFWCLEDHGKYADCPKLVKDKDGRNISKCPVEGCKHVHHKLLHGGKLKMAPRHQRSNCDDQDKADSDCCSETRSNYAILPTESARPPSTVDQGSPLHAERGEEPGQAGRAAKATQESINKMVAMSGKAKGATLRLFKIMFRMADGDKSCKPITTVALADNGSSICIVDEATVRLLKQRIMVKFEEGPSTIHGSRYAPSAEVDLEISRDGRNWTKVEGAETFRNLRLKGPELRWKDFITTHPAFQQVDADNVKFSEVRMILGAQLEDALLPLNKPGSRIMQDGVSAYKTELGWTIGGCLNTVLGCPRAYSMLPRVPAKIEWQQDKEKEQLSIALLTEFRRFNDLDTLGIQPRAIKLSRQQQKEQDMLDTTTVWHNGRITTRMLWKGRFASLPETEPMARKRLGWLQKKLLSGNIWDKYAATIETDVAKGYVKKLTTAEAEDLRKGPHWFLPHFVVLHPDKPDRPRRVLDCAAKSDGLSLNSLLGKGPKNLADLWGVTQRSRAQPVLFIGDVTEMFSQVAVAKGDERMLAFLWAEKPEDEPSVYVNVRHVFGAKSSPAVAINALHAAVARRCPQHLEMVRREIYMDDWLHGDATAEEAIRVADEVLAALQGSSFIMGKFVSNSKEFLDHFPADKISPKFREIQEKEGEDYSLPTLKALGLRWNAEDDTLGFSTRLKPAEPKTLAECLSQLASVFDPTYIIGPYFMAGKMLFQAFFCSGKGWKDPLSSEEVEAWMSWVHGLPDVARLSIPRWFGFPALQPVTLHVFSDASTGAYGAVAYLVTVDGKRSFVAGKGRVLSKRKALIIARGELQALLLGVRLMETTLEELQGYVSVIRVVCWVDSAIVYCWVRNQEKLYKEFVANRLAEIFEAFKRYEDLNPEVRWVPTDQNPADLISRSCDSATMADKFEFWTQGPRFLSEQEAEWPSGPPIPVKAEDELLKERVVAAAPPRAVDGEFDAYADLASYLEDQGVEPRLLVRGTRSGLVNLELGEEELVKRVQHDSFAAEMEKLADLKEKAGPNKPSSMYFRRGPLVGKEVFLDDRGVVRMVTRLANAEWMPWAAKYPAVLSAGHGASRLLIREAHQAAGHEGARTTYSGLVRKLYLPFNAVKKEVFRCQECRRAHPLRMSVPIAALHRTRLQPWTSVFHHTGMDFFGPFELTGRRRAWGLLFTCLTVRAVHLEVCQDMTVDAWLNAVERFMARRGKPASITCDNGGTFVGGNKKLQAVVRAQLKALLKDDLTEAMVRKHQVEFHFIPPGTPHYGGAWESLVRQVQRNLMKTIGLIPKLTIDKLATFMTRAEAALNSRPLAIGDEMDLITPMSVLGPATTMAYGFEAEVSLARVAGQLRQAIDHFWKTWSTSYLQQLSPHRLRPGSPGYVELMPGSKVAFKRHEPFHRLSGSKPEAGTITKVHRSQDGIARRYTVQDTRGKLVEIPAGRLFIVEQDLVELRGPAIGSAPRTPLASSDRK
jgi:transposase InsO family protein